MSGTVRTTIDESVCTVTLENEGKRNAISYPMMEELVAEIRSLESKDDDYVLVLRGAGTEAFSAGFDLSQDRRDEPGEGDRLWSQMIAAIEEYSYPTIAMINGHTYGGAVEVIAACDIRIGRSGAQFGITPAKIGLVYRPDAITRVMDLVGPGKTKEMLFTAEPIDADHAYDTGLLDRLVSADELEDHTYDMAATIAANAPLSLQYMKRIVNAVLESRSLSETEREWASRFREEAFESRDHEEGVAAFSEDRDPEFEGR